MPWISPTASVGGVLGVLPIGIDPFTAAIQQRIAFQQLARFGMLSHPWSVAYPPPWGQVGSPFWGQQFGNLLNVAPHQYQPIGVDPLAAAAAQLVPVA